mgnify:CR=1 FL=1
MLMTFTGCGTSKEVSVLSESVETETVMEDTSTDEVTDNIQEETTETEQQASESDEIIEESTLEEEKVQLEEEGQNEETSVLEEVKETMENDPDAADLSLTQEELDMLDSILDNGDDIEYTFSTDPNDGEGLEYSGDNSVLNWE